MTEPRHNPDGLDRIRAPLAALALLAALAATQCGCGGAAGIRLGWFACVCQNQRPETTSNNAAKPPTNIRCMTFPHDDIMAIGPQSYQPVKACPISRGPDTLRTDIAKMDKGRSFRPLGNAGSG